MTKIALIDDHTIFCDSLSSLVNEFEGFSVCWTANDGVKAIQLLEQKENLPDIILLDIIMPGMSGIEVAKWIFENKKDTKVLALTMEEDDNSVIQMLQYGLKGYLLKSVGAEELLTALQQVVKYGYYYTPIITGNIHKQIEKRIVNGNAPELGEREKELLNYLCTDMSYAEISKKMFLSESTVDTYRARLFEKFEVKNRIGLVLKAVHMDIVKL
ncbi:MAG: response regulator transcription factor [Bacteroidota bacterium]|nr:response regulator transcription factor [Bacteroidota bacterium]